LFSKDQTIYEIIENKVVGGDHITGAVVLVIIGEKVKSESISWF